MEVERLQAVLEASGLTDFQAKMQAADRTTEATRRQLEQLAAVSKVASESLQRIKLIASQAAETGANAEFMRKALGKIADEAGRASDKLDKVRIDSGAAFETTANGDVIDRKLKDITGNANEARRALESVRITATLTNGAGASGGGAGLAGGGVGLLGAGIGAGAVLAPAAAPAALGLLGGIPVLAATGAGALGTLMLAFDDVSKAISGNKKAYDNLSPAQQQFTQEVRSLYTWENNLEQIASSAMFPGLSKGLHEALSPGMVSAIAKALQEFGTAIGQAGEMWGRYFGSSQFQAIFGPLMKAGAHNISLMSDSALHLFDALGVLARATIPLVTWLLKGGDAAARWVDGFLRAKDASGGLSRAMNEAKTTLKLVGELVGSLAKVVYELGAALYPVSKVLLKDLVGGLVLLAKLIAENRQAISLVARTFVSDFIAVVKVSAQVVTALVHGLSDLIGHKNAVIAVITAIGAAITLALGGPWALVAAAAIVAIGEIIRHWSAVKDFFKTLGQWILNVFEKDWVLLQRGALQAAMDVVEPFSHLPSFLGGWARKAKDSMQAELDKLVPPDMSWSQAAHDAGVKTGQAWIAGFQSQTAAAAAGVPADTAAKAAAGVAKNPGQSYYNAKQIYQLLLSAGFSAADASNFVGIAKAESGGNFRALNNNPATGDYSVGLFQENFFKNLGPARTARYAPMFGLSGSMAPTAFVAWLQQHPAAQATIAHDLFSSSGYSPWQGDAFIKAHPELLSGGASAGSPWGTPPPFTSGLGRKPRKPPAPPVIPASAAHLLALAGTAAANASALSNTGSAAKAYLEAELKDLSLAYDQLHAAFESAHGKAKTQLDKAMHGVENKIIRVLKEISDAIVIAGDALLPEKLREKMKKATAHYTADSDYAAVLTGGYADRYRKTIQGDLTAQQMILKKEIESLKSRLAGSSGKQKAAIQAELTKVTGELDKVQQGILSSLQGNVTYMQTKVGNYFSSITQEFDKALGKLFFQNGAKTPLEKQLADMQSQDQLTSLQDAITQAQEQLGKDANTLAAVVYDSTTGITKNVYSPGAQKQLAADQKALSAAERQLEEYNLGIRAAQERARMDSEYATQVEGLNKRLSDLSEQFANGQGSMKALSDIAALYGLQISTSTIPDFANLSSASAGLKDAFKDLADYIAQITNTTPKVPAGPPPGAPLGFPGSASGQDSAFNWIFGPGGLPTMPVFPWEIPSHADGGPTKAGLAMLHDGEFVVPKGGTLVKGGGGGGGVNVVLNVSALDPASVDWSSIADKVYAEFLRKKTRNGGKLNLN